MQNDGFWVGTMIDPSSSEEEADEDQNHHREGSSHGSRGSHHHHSHPGGGGGGGSVGLTGGSVGSAGGANHVAGHVSSLGTHGGSVHGVHGRSGAVSAPALAAQQEAVAAGLDVPNLSSARNSLSPSMGAAQDAVNYARSSPRPTSPSPSVASEKTEAELQVSLFSHKLPLKWSSGISL